MLFDIGHGMGSLDFEVAKKMIGQGFAPDVISSDIHLLCIDGPAFDLLASIPGGRIHVLQLDDAGPPADVDPMVETMTDRRLPGEGVVDLPALLAALDAIGADPVLAPEVFSAANAADGPAEAARRIVEATRRVVGA